MPVSIRAELRQLSADVDRLRRDVATTIARMAHIQAELDSLPHAKAKRRQLRRLLTAPVTTRRHS